MTSLPILRLHPGRHKRALSGHPWIFSNELVLSEASKSLQPGSIVSYQAHDGTVIGVGSYNPRTLIAGRVFSRSPIVSLDADWFKGQLQAALALREKLVPSPYYRLVHAEADGLPGLIIDRFGDAVSVQLNCAGMEALWTEIEKALIELLKPSCIILHNDSSARSLEGLPQEVRCAYGTAPSGAVEVVENGVTYFADLMNGQKTGWYFDQRDNHLLMSRFAKGKSVLDLYTHAGGFALLAAAEGASRVLGVDSSASALSLAEAGAKKNKLQSVCSWQRADVFEFLSEAESKREAYDIVIADPPPFVKSRKDIASGARGYRKLAAKSARVTAKGGLLYIASCSHNMDLTLFTEEVAKGLHESKRQGKIIYTCFAAPDHPTHPFLPESAYLKALVIQLDG